MDEKVLTQSKQYNVKKFFRDTVIIGVVLSIVFFAISMVKNIATYNEYYVTYQEHSKEGDCGWLYDSWERCWECERVQDYPNKILFAIALTFQYDWFAIIPAAFCVVFGGLIYGWLRSYELVVTDKRIYGNVAWGKRVDLPVDSVSATATVKLLKGVTVSTSSGKISFLMIKNADEVYEVINKLVIERQTQAKAAPVKQEAPASSLDELKKVKDLLDAGIITQEEFDAKKKQLLGL